MLTPLHLATLNGHVAVLESLVRLGVDVNTIVKVSQYALSMLHFIFNYVYRTMDQLPCILLLKLVTC